VFECGFGYIKTTKNKRNYINWLQPAICYRGDNL